MSKHTHTAAEQTRTDCPECDIFIRVASALNELRPELKAYPENTGGGVICVYLVVDSRDEWHYWGVSNENWGADVNQSCDDEFFATLEADIAAESDDARAIAASIIKAIDSGERIAQ